MNKILNMSSAVLDKKGLEDYMKKLASDHILKNKSDKNTYPIQRLKENYEYIYMVFKLLNEHLRQNIPIHPAGEWVLDNFYIIEKTIKTIIKDLTLKKYTNFIGIESGANAGFARIYVIASEIISYTDGKIDEELLKELLKSYQTKKTLNMDEIWNIGLFLQIALIENIRNVCEKIYYSQMQKYKVENIIERLVENKEEDKLKYKNISINRIKSPVFSEMKYPFIEYMSYKLRSYGKVGYPFINILENEVKMMGTTVSDVIKKEHFDIAVRKVSIGNSIISINTISRMNFLKLFEEINGVEEILKSDPANIYEKMDYKTKIYYRNKIKEISKKTKISEIYIAKKIIELANQNLLKNDNHNIEKNCHIGYFLVDEGKQKLINSLTGKNKKLLKNNAKVKLYISFIYSISFILSIIFGNIIYKRTKNLYLSILIFLLSIIPYVTILKEIVQNITNRFVKPKLIPKLELTGNITKKYSTMVIIPTIIKTKEKIQELAEKMEVFYLANKSENLYFTILGDCTSSSKEQEDFDEEIAQFGRKIIKDINIKYPDKEFQKFNFIYRKRTWNEKEECFLGYERKRGFINQFNEYILHDEKFEYFANTIEEIKNEKTIPKIKYIITLDSDTDLVLNSAFELIGSMAHILNKPILNKTKDKVIDGYGIIAPRVGVGLKEANKNIFTKIFAGLRTEQIVILIQYQIFIKIILKKEFLQEKVYMI